MVLRLFAGKSLVAVCLAVAIAAPVAAIDGAIFDGDSDGVADERDGCLDTAPGVAVGEDGCSAARDADRDGVSDALDVCPLSPAGAITDAQGCSLDEDVDGVADGLDRCSGTRVSVTVNDFGCSADQKPRTLARAPAPNRPMQALVSAPGLAKAEEGPKTRLDLPITQTAAPQLSARRQLTAAAKSSQTTVTTIPFNAGETDLSTEAIASIDASIAEWQQWLSAHPQSVMIVSGHSETKTDGASAPRVAAMRAVAVRQHLLSKGVQPRMLHMIAPGVSQPRFFGTDLARNARVEIRLQESPSLQLAASSTPTAKLGASNPLEGTRVSFSLYSFALSAVAQAQILSFAESLQARLPREPMIRVSITGAIADQETGLAAHRLAIDRATAVQNYLLRHGIALEILDVAQGAADNAGSGSGPRVEIRVLKP